MEAYQMEQRGIITEEGDRAREAIEYNKFHQIAVNTANWIKEKPVQLLHKIREYYGYGGEEKQTQSVNIEQEKQNYLDNILANNRENKKDNDKDFER